MQKILGIDLGTNSIGWALRNPDLPENQIEKFGVLTFNKGVGIGKTGEYSYAAERTKKRSVRRLYQARKYRLWATLYVLIEEGYCPLSIDDLNKWRHYSKEEARKNNNGGRVYPVSNASFDAWVKLDFDNDGKPDYSSPYQLRRELAEVRLDFNEEVNRFKLGRALYHIAQRRGFKSSRKVNDEPKEKEVDIFDENETTLQRSEKKKSDKLTALFTDYDSSVPIGVFLANKEDQGIRVRLDITQYLVRENYKDEIKFIFNFQGLKFEDNLYTKLVESGKNKNDGCIFYKRPLRSQKGLVGKCTLETQKYRAPISHPAFEAFRAWSFLNNIKYKPSDQVGGSWQGLPLELKQNIYHEKFFRKSKAYFPFAEIIEFVKAKGHNWELNYSSKTTVTACPVSARLKEIFGEDYLNVKIEKEKAKKSDKNFYSIEDIWHILFTCEDEEFVSEFAESKLNLDADEVRQFVIAWNACPVGYGMLSLNAINKINIFLLKGLIYTEAVLLAKIPEILGNDIWSQNEQLLLRAIGEIISENRQQKAILGIVNNLVSKHKNLEAEEQFGRKDNNYKLAESDLRDIQAAIDEQFGANKWSGFSEDKKKAIRDTVRDCYQAYFAKQGVIRDFGSEERLVTIQSNGKKYYKTESGYYQLPKLMDTLKEFLQDNFEHLDERALSKIYHPSEISIYPPAKPDIDGVLKLGSPKTGSFKNPMAMRTLHELRKLMNHMIETNQINSETRVVVEVARDLNDANKRWAIETWQRQREAENQEFAEAIKQLLLEDCSIKADVESNDDIDKVRLFYEQNTEQTLPGVSDVEENEKGKKNRKKSEEKNEAVRWIGHGTKLIDKYRLWKEQGYQCMYTGKLIKLTDLFNENVVDFEHTIPRSKSFDNTLANLTVCYHDYNRTIKKNQIPTQLLNFDKAHDFGASIGVCGPIKPRLKAWEEKVERIKQQIDFWQTKSKYATDKKWKDDAIRQKHLWKMELDYWQSKLGRFTVTEITSGFKNSQRVDTQLISKYAFHYLKTYFDKVDIQRGSITAEFRKIYQLQSSDEKKDRTKHSHHAKDAAVLTLIPVAAKRDQILESYYKAKEDNQRATFIAEPYKGFKREFVWSIDESVLINNLVNNQELTPAKRKVRRRGKEVIINGKMRWATGDSIRGQLHLETFYGAIKPAQVEQNGKTLRRDEHGEYVQVDEPKYVLRVPFDADFNSVDKIVDRKLRSQIEEHIEKAGSFKKAYEEGIYLLNRFGKPHGNRIRHIRVYKDGEVKKPLAIKKQTNLSAKEYKHSYWAANATNSFFAVYSCGDKKDFDFRNLFDTAKILTVNRIKDPTELFEQALIKQNKKYNLTYVLVSGAKIIFRKDQEDLKNLDNCDILKRLYVYTNFEKDGRLNFKYHLDARGDKDITEDYKDSAVNFENPAPTLRLRLSKCDFAVEGYDFSVEMDGTVKWLK